MIFWQPDPAQPPKVMGFASHDDAKVGHYFGPNIFADTPFQNAPVLHAQIEVETGADFVETSVGSHFPHMLLRTATGDNHPMRTGADVAILSAGLGSRPDKSAALGE